ncbi:MULTISPECIES: hypothetical protein [Halomonadaceae]|uniref:Uncharacterized protein n=2 Tax=Vreelandella TaxID=3137766 RepID=A0A7Z0LX09_9GAMM|nr:MULTISPECIES: hypothetical protein [Halomonas]NYS80240.1 hypothetical protein [Halomonas glaciei]|tara:strand:+ start:105 stop:440 length:336 start_codon:yes stop_codon:yes gene_type:complete
MINTIQAHVIGASRYKMDNGVQGAKISIMQAASADNENAIGNQVSIMTAPYDIFDQLHATAPHMPCAMELDIELRTSSAAAGGKTVLHVIAARKPNATGSQPQPATHSDKK